MGFGTKGYLGPATNSQCRRNIVSKCGIPSQINCCVKYLVPSSVIYNNNNQLNFSSSGGFTGYWHGVNSIYEK